MKYTIKPIVCDYAVIRIGTKENVCICNIKRNAELIADILNGDTDNSCAYSYDVYPYAKYNVGSKAPDIINELEKIKAEITEYRREHNCGVVECLDLIDKHIKIARQNRYKKVR